MMFTQRALRFTLLISTLALILTGCGADDSDDKTKKKSASGNTIGGLPAGTVNLSIQGTAPGSLTSTAALVNGVETATSVDLSVGDTAGIEIGILTLTDARLALKEFKLELAESETDGIDEDGDGDEDADDIATKNAESDKVKFEGPYVVDLITDVVSPSLDSVNFIAGVYEEIEMKLDKIDGSEDDDDGTVLIDSTDPLFGNSIYMEGTYTGATASGQVTDVPFVLSFDFGETFELTGAGDTSEGFEITADSINPIIIAFRLATWLDFSNPETNDKFYEFSQLVLTKDASGTDVILLDEDAVDPNDEIRRVIKENIKESADYGKDLDGDGELDSDEDDDLDSEDDDD